MNRKLVRRVALGSAALMLAASTVVRAATAPAEQVASVDQLKIEAFKDLRDGNFDRSTELLAQAAALSHDPVVKQMADWTNGFDTQQQQFSSERHQQFEKRLDEMKLLLSKNKPEDALDRAALAYLLTDDKKAFRAEKDVDDLVTTEESRADDFDRDEQWIQSQRIYQNLAQIDPSVPKWKDKLTLSTRRERLLALYTPVVFRQMLDADTKLRNDADAIIHPQTQPATQPAAEADADSFKIDWHETLHGVKEEMLWEALVYARNNWYRDVTYKTLATGGLDGLKVVVETRGLEQAFPHLADAKARESFLGTIDQCLANTDQATGIGEQTTLHDTLQKLELANQATVALPEEVLVSEFADGAFGKLDKFSTVLWPSDMDDFKRTTQGEFSGVGIQIRSDPDGSLKVVQPLPDSPAIKAGIKPEDVITRIDGKSAKGISTNQAVKIITGPAGTQVVLTIRSLDNSVRDYTLIRQTITVASIKGWIPKGDGWDYFIDPDQKIAYMRLTNFAGNTPKEMNAAIEQMKAGGARGIILDLRFDPGGLLSSATEIADRFLHDGVIVSTRPDRDTGNPPTVAVAKPDADDIDLPLVILVNQYSASASEIVSGALKDQKRAILVGERTFGKGSVQMLFPLDDKSAYFKLTTSHYYLPSGRCIHREENSTEWGVDPDVTVQMTPEQMSAAITAREELDIPKQLQAAAAPSVAPTTAPSAAEAIDKAVDPHGAGPSADPQARALQLPDQASTPTTAPAKTVAVVKKDLLSVDPQLSAAVLILRLKVNGAAL